MAHEEKAASVPIELMRDIRKLISDLVENEYCTCADDGGKCKGRCLFSKASSIQAQLEGLHK